MVGGIQSPGQNLLDHMASLFTLLVKELLFLELLIWHFHKHKDRSESGTQKHIFHQNPVNMAVTWTVSIGAPLTTLKEPLKP